jgi:hypothetical protein
MTNCHGQSNKNKKKKKKKKEKKEEKQHKHKTFNINVNGDHCRTAGGPTTPTTTTTPATRIKKLMALAEAIVPGPSRSKVSNAWGPSLKARLLYFYVQ